MLFAVVDAGALAVLPLVVVLVINVAHDSVYGPQAAWFAEQFPVRVRYSGVNLGYQLGTVVGGGFAPFIAALLVSVALLGAGVESDMGARLSPPCVDLGAGTLQDTQVGREPRQARFRGPGGLDSQAVRSPGPRRVVATPPPRRPEQ